MTPEPQAMAALIALVKAVTKTITLLGVIPAKDLFDTLERQGLSDSETFDRLMSIVCSTGFVKREGLVFRRTTDAERAAAAEAMLTQLESVQEEIRLRREEAAKRE